MNKLLNTVFILLALFCFSIKQSNAQDDKIRTFEAGISDAIRLIDDEKKHQEALELLLSLESKPKEELIEQENNEEHLSRIEKAYQVINAHIVDCYVNIDDQITKAIPYFEKLENTNYHRLLKLEFKDAGEMYMQNYNFDKAIKYFEVSLKTPQEAVKYSPQVHRKIQMCKNAKKILSSDTITHVIKDLDKPITTDASELAPYINRDGSILYFTKEEIIRKGGVKTKIKTFMFSIKNSYLWEEPQKLKFSNSILFDISTTQMAGISPNGDKVYFNIEENGNTDIYEAEVRNGVCVRLVKLKGTVNTAEYNEGKVAFSDDGTTMYFVSSRPGGIGGTDIYTAKKLVDGSWNKVVDMSSAINSVYNEDCPWVVGDVLYFSSNGHESMGGYDIFKSVKHNDIWIKATNVGFPINTIQDNLVFSVSDKYKKGYFSSSRLDKNDTHDIYMADVGNNIAITCLRGMVKGGHNKESVKAKITIQECHSGKIIDHVYDPETKPGDYLAVLRPGRDYKIFIEDLSKKYAPQSMLVRIPRQSDFYAIFQDIRLQELVPINEKIGDKIIIENSFFDALVEDKPEDKEIYYTQLLVMIEKLILKSDNYQLKKLSEIKWTKKEKEKDYSELMNMVENAIETSDTVSMRMLEKVAQKPDVYEKRFLYQPGDTSALETVIVDGIPFRTAPTISAFPLNTGDVLAQRLSEKLRHSVTLFPHFQEVMDEAKKKSKDKNYKHTIYFQKNSNKISREYKARLEQLSDFLIANSNSTIAITGYCDSEEYSPNLILSEERVANIIAVLSANGIIDENLKKEYKLGKENKKEENKKVVIEIKNIEDLKTPEINNINQY